MVFVEPTLPVTSQPIDATDDCLMTAYDKMVTT